MAFGIYGLLLGLMAVMKFAAHTDVGRLLNRHLVERPVKLLAKMERHHLIFMLIAVGLLLAGGEALFALGPADFALVYALDLSLYIDGLLAAIALASLVRTRSAAAALRVGAGSLAARMRRVFGRRRVRDASERRVRKPSANDDDHPAVAVAA